MICVDFRVDQPLLIDWSVSWALPEKAWIPVRSKQCAHVYSRCNLHIIHKDICVLSVVRMYYCCSCLFNRTCSDWLFRQRTSGVDNLWWLLHYSDHRKAGVKDEVDARLYAPLWESGHWLKRFLSSRNLQEEWVKVSGHATLVMVGWSRWAMEMDIVKHVRCGFSWPMEADHVNDDPRWSRCCNPTVKDVGLTLTTTTTTAKKYMKWFWTLELLVLRPCMFFLESAV